MNTTSSKEVAMKVNQANLVRSLKFSFTNKTTVLGELMQNARRAKATQVLFEFAPETKILRVTDNGCGIDSIETLLTVAESGWDAEVVAHEHPFGIGFMSALFVCRHLTVVSKSGRISADTDDVLAFKPITVTPVLLLISATFRSRLRALPAAFPFLSRSTTFFWIDRMRLIPAFALPIRKLARFIVLASMNLPVFAVSSRCTCRACLFIVPSMLMGRVIVMSCILILRGFMRVYRIGTSSLMRPMW